ncbi:PAS domain-containing sensor histidine kinase [Anaerobaca lacustris]|uniref:Oxygen sensor histidine kinase NreB n=1 Tax=Anaerobaca lacustris TaxID=3044600 RepID=A0AAW6U118_9BACT|nr:PAS domain S-box protein [Sedimentisphaerales bacterium M17dextr]
MPNKPNLSADAAELRRRAEERLRGQQGGTPRTDADTQRLLHELQVHQVELEMQNAELLEARDQMEAMLEKYTDLYDFAPVGYFSIDEQGLISEVNLTGAALLGVERSRLIGRRLPHFLSSTSQPVFLAFLEKVFAGPGRQVCEVSLLNEDGAPFWASLQAVAVPSLRGERKWCRMAVSDITALKRAEEAMHKLTATLESRVVRRTAELEQRTRQLQKLALEMLQTEDRERKRLADILHDDLQQQLAGAKFHLGLLHKRIDGDASLRDAIDQITVMLKEAIAKSRSLSHELRPAVLSYGDFGEAIEWLANHARVKHGLVVHMELCGPLDVSSDSIKVFLFHTAQEMLFNIVKHADVAEAVVRLRWRHGRLWLTVCDHGRGFDPKTLGRTGGSGLLSIRERVELLGGRMKVRSAPGRGSTFLIIVPDADTSARIVGAESVEERKATQARTGKPAKPDKEEKGSLGDARERKCVKTRAVKSPKSHTG